MTPQLLAVLVVVALAASAVAGPWLLRKSVPMMVRFPRVAAWLIVGAVLAWPASVLALGPLLAWALSGPALLPDAAARVCQQCLAAANPFGAAPVASSIPIVVLLAVPTAALIVLAALVTRDLTRRAAATRQLARQLRARGSVREVLGTAVFVVSDDRSIAMSLPRRQLGVVISRATLRALDDRELAAVLAHETAHVNQRHHAITALVGSLAKYLRWVPLIAAAADALGSYLEIAADDAARSAAGTPALVSALLRLGESRVEVVGAAEEELALHIDGPHRIRHLVQPHVGADGLLHSLFATASVSALALLSMSVFMPYLFAGITACAI